MAGIIEISIKGDNVALFIRIKKAPWRGVPYFLASPNGKIEQGCINASTSDNYPCMHIVRWQLSLV